MDELRGYYAGYDEWARLERPAGLLELYRTLRIVEAHLPASARVLDLGAGPGRYSLALAKKGHRVTLADLSPEQLAVAREKLEEAGLMDRVEAVLECDARDLSELEDGLYDAALCMGPFYHLTEAEERDRAAAELARVLRPGSPAFVSFIPFWSGIAALIPRAAADPEQVPPLCLRQAASRGTYRNPVPGGFTQGWFARPEEIRDCLEGAGFQVLEVLSVRGLADGNETALWELDERAPDRFEAALELIERTAADPEVVATCGHALVVARRRAS